MILAELKQYLINKQQASLFELTQYFKVTQAAILPMLEVWVRKGKVRQCRQTSKCGITCGKCDAALVEIFQWVG